LSFADAAAQILKEFGNGTPMHYREITRLALKQGLIATTGKTPESTLYAVVLTEIERYTLRGQTPRFVKHGKGYVGLSAWSPLSIAAQIDHANRQVRSALLDRLKAMPPAAFEELIGNVLGEIGFEEISKTSYTNDGGIDLRGTMVVGGVIRTDMAVQVKRWKANVQAPTIQQVRGSLGTHEQGLIITTADFSKGAREEADRANAVPVAIMNGEQLVALMVEHGIGVGRQRYDLLSLPLHLQPTLATTTHLLGKLTMEELEGEA
jgi:restriction system protein